jgi:hypothetical protein
MRKLLFALLGCVLLLGCSGVAFAQGGGQAAGQTLYVPCSTATYHGPKNRQLDLTITLIVRNLDTKRGITLTAVDYHRTDGGLVRRYLDKPVTLAPLAAREVVVEQSDSTGGSAASFLVRWRGDAGVNAPLAEAVMISTSNSLGISYVSRGVPIKE